MGKDQSTVSEVKNSEVTSSSTSSSRVADITNGASSLSISQHKTTTGATSVLPSPHVCVCVCVCMYVCMLGLTCA